MGFDALWISPVVKNFKDGYHGYWASHFNEVNEHFGDEEDLKQLVRAAHERDIYVMVDVVPNHVGYLPAADEFSAVEPFNDASHYHEDCEIRDWNDQWQLENCRLCGLPDLAQENEFVRTQLLEWVTRLV